MVARPCVVFFFSTGGFSEVPAAVQNGVLVQDEAVTLDLTVHVPNLDVQEPKPTAGIDVWA